MAELLKEAGLPDGVFNVVHGDKVAVDAILEHPDIAAITLRRLDAGRAPHLPDRHRATGSGCRRWAARRTTWSCCRMPTSRWPPMPPSPPPTAPPASAAWRSASWSRSATWPIRWSTPSRSGCRRSRSGRATRRARRWARSSRRSTATRWRPTWTAGRVPGRDAAGRRAGARALQRVRGLLPRRRACSTTSRPRWSATATRSSGPVLEVVRAPDYPTALKIVNENQYGNGTAIFTRDGGAARQYQFDVNVGHGRPQRADPGAGRVLQLRRLEGVAVRRPPHVRARRGSSSTRAARSSPRAGRIRARRRWTWASRARADRASSLLQQLVPERAGGCARTPPAAPRAVLQSRFVVPVAHETRDTAGDSRVPEHFPSTLREQGEHHVPSPPCLARIRAGHDRRAGRVSDVPMAVSAAKPTVPKLGLHDEQLLAKARIEGRATVTILVAAKGAAAKQAEAAVTNAGGTVRYRDAALGYIRADVPTEKVAQVASNASVQAVDLDEVVPLPDPRPRGRRRDRQPAAAGRHHAPRQPVHADPGHRRRRVPRRASDLGRPRRDDRDRGLRRLARSPEPERHQHRRAQDRRLGDRHGSPDRRRPDLDQHGDAGERLDRHVPGRDLHRPGGRLVSRSDASTSASRRSAARLATT